MNNGRRRLTDADIANELEQRVTSGLIHESNLEKARGKGSRRDQIGALAFSTLALIARVIPRSTGYSLFSALAQLLFTIIPIIRRSVEGRLRLAFPAASISDLRNTRRQVARQFGKTAFELLDDHRFSECLLDRVTIEGQENVDLAISEGRPIILVHAHQANWEIMLDLGEKVTRNSLCALYSPLAIPSIQRRQLHRRTRNGSRFYPRSARMSVGYVRRDMLSGHALIVALDQRASNTYAPFFGRPARSTIIPLKLGARLGAHILPLDLRRKANDGHFHLTIHPNLFMPGDDKDLEAVLSRYNSLLERWIRERPADWFWLHDRWGDGR